MDSPRPASSGVVDRTAARQCPSLCTSNRIKRKHRGAPATLPGPNMGNTLPSQTMASQLYDPDTDRRDCALARYFPHESISNVDMSGITVGVATVVVTFCLRIQIAWSRAPIDGAVISSFIQLYSILLSTLLSINRPQLSLFDANHALIITSSFLVIWLVFTSISYLSGIETEVFKRIQSHRATICTLGVLFLPLWLGLNLTISLSSRGFIDSELCSDSTFKERLLMDPILLPTILCLSILPLLLSPLFVPVLPSFFLLLYPCLLYIAIASTHVSAVSLFFEGPLPDLVPVLPLFSIGGASFWFAASFPLWNASTHSSVLHIGRAFTVLDFYWATAVIRNATAASGSEYVLSYGQLVALSAAVYPLMSTVKLGYDRRWDLFDFFRHLPERVWRAVPFR